MHRGWRRSAFDDTNQRDMEGVQFWTKIKTVAQRLRDGGVGDVAKPFVVPTVA